MKSRFTAALGALSLLVLFGSSNGLQLTNNPISYFGGQDYDNQDYLNWADSISSVYNASVYLPSSDPSKGAAIHWTIEDDEWLRIAVAARCTGWVGFGLAESGGMPGSDMALFVASRPNEIIDAHVVEELRPRTDDCQQDWIIVENSVLSSSSSVKQADSEVGEQGDFLMFEARRKLDTGDPQDKKIVRDDDPVLFAQKIIAAWGDDAEVSYHGKNVVRGSIRFFDSKNPATAFQKSMEANAEQSFLVTATNFTIPPTKTNYVYFCVTQDDLIRQGILNSTSSASLIGILPILNTAPSTSVIVHHFVLYGSYDSEKCTEDTNVMYVWGPGEDPLALPDFLGIPIFGSDLYSYKSFRINIHYDNPLFEEGITDSSGVELFITSQPREFEVGYMMLADKTIALGGQPVGDGLAEHTFECQSGCSSLFLDADQPVTVLREYLHMHLKGTRITNTQMRNGSVVRESSYEVFDFEQSGGGGVRQNPFQVFAGDSFRTTCYFRGSADLKFGLGSEEEMCVASFVYYPRKVIYGNPWSCPYRSIDSLPVCSSYENYTTRILEDDSLMKREFGKLLPQCNPDDVTTTSAASKSLGVALSVYFMLVVYMAAFV